MAKSKEQLAVEQRQQNLDNQYRKALLRQEVGEIPECADPERRERCCACFKSFCEEYFDQLFTLEWSDDHLNLLQLIEDTVKNGGLSAVAMPRGSGKTTILQAACVWATLSGHRKFVSLIATNKKRAKELLGSIKLWLDTNPKLVEDFPEVCIPIRRLENIPNRQNTQRHNGEMTRIRWEPDKVVYPYLEESELGGVILTCCGMKGSDIRGQIHSTVDGSTIRPDLVFIDDPQSRDTAFSNSQCDTRSALISGDVLGMAGPGKKIAGLLACTVIRPGDLADRILDRKEHPDWRGIKTKMVYKWPDNEDLWIRYGEMRRECLENDEPLSVLNDFYEKNREAMDAGAEVGWPHNYDCTELSALQHAYNLYFRDPNAFMAEYQNEPVDTAESSIIMDEEDLLTKFSGYARGVVPEDVDLITAFIDVQKNCLYYLVAGFTQEFTSYVLDYGTFPSQRVKDFTAAAIPKTLQQSFPGMGLEAQIYEGLTQLVDELSDERYLQYEDDRQGLISSIMIDASWGQLADTVYQVCRSHQHRRMLKPAHGQFVGAKSRQWGDLEKKKGERRGLHWRVMQKSERPVPYVLVDTNYWKSFTYARLSVKRGDSGCLSFYGAGNSKHSLHGPLVKHLLSEYFVKTEANGKTVEEWKLRPGETENHWFDCLVGTQVAASIEGATLPAVVPKEKMLGRRKITSMAEAKAKARERKKNKK